jgi:hypothetical protein
MQAVLCSSAGGCATACCNTGQRTHTRRCRAQLQASFTHWLDVTEAQREARGRIRRCIGGKRIAQSAFKVWYSSHLEDSVSQARHERCAALLVQAA